jgi:hypothetical protein
VWFLLILYDRALFLPGGAWVLLQYAVNILGYATAKNEAKGEISSLSAGR